MPVDILSEGQKSGFLNVSRQGLYTKFYGETNREDLCRIYGVFEGGEVPLGVPVPERGKMVLRVSMPSSKLPGGRLLRGEVRTKQPEWTYFPGGKIGGVVLPEGRKKGKLLRFPWKPGEALPAEEMLLFYSFVSENGQDYLEISFEDVLRNRSEL